MPLKVFAGTAAYLLILGGPCRAELYINGYDPAKHDRFYSGAGKAFIGQAFDWSGVGRIVDTTQVPSGLPTLETQCYQFVTMISPSYFVTATHTPVYSGNGLVFHEGNTFGVKGHLYGASRFIYNIPGTDLTLGKLSSPIPASDHIAYYSLCLLPSPSDYVNREIYVYGKQNRVGRNQITSAGSLVSFTYNTTTGLGADECYLISGDSGGPSFAVVNNALALVGVHHSHSSEVVQDGVVSYDWAVYYYASQLAQQMWIEQHPNVMFMANFEDDAVNAIPIATWVHSNTGANVNIVISSNSSGSIKTTSDSSPGGNGQNAQTLKMKVTSPTGANNAKVFVDKSYRGTIPTNTSMELSLKFKMNSWNSTDKISFWAVGLDASRNNQNIALASSDGSQPLNWMMSGNQSLFQDPGQFVHVGHWYAMTIQIDLVHQQYRTIVADLNGTDVSLPDSWHPLPASNITSVTGWYLSTDTASQTLDMEFDDLSLSLGPNIAFSTADFSAVRAAMDARTGEAGWNAIADVDQDGEITSSDLAIVLAGLQ